LRGVRALRQAPLVLAVFFLTTCRFDLQLTEPSVEVDGKSAYQTGNSIVIDYKFTADEPSLRCKYAVNTAGSVVQQGVTGSFPPGTWQQLRLDLNPNPVEGEYNVQLMAQAPRGEGFVNLAFLTKTFKFLLDFDNPAEPEFSPVGALFSDNVQVTLSHAEWSAPSGSPVSIYYTTNQTDPTSSSSRYIVGSPIAVLLSETPTEIRAIAIDDSGRSSAIKSEIFSFINIDYIHSNSESGPLNEFDTSIPAPQWIFVNGYGLSNVSSAEFKDADGTTAATIAVMSKTSLQVILAVSLPDGGIFAGDGTTMDGTLKVFDFSGVSDAIKINLVPEP
jgi:hypothetical protein